MFNFDLVRPTKEEMKSASLPHPSFQEKYLLSAPTSFNFTPHAKELSDCSKDWS